jgi:hypothetical protein
VYLPIIMGNEGDQLPQRAQWSFCHAVYPGQVFTEGEPLVAGNLKMLQANECEGLVRGTGWDPEGLWTYFASFYGHAWLWQGDGRKATECLYALANHASPTLAWREEQSPKGASEHTVGDMPHNWASAEFIRLAVHLLALDRGDELHLLTGMPPEWVRPNMVTRLDRIATPFGPLTMKLAVADNGEEAQLTVRPLSACDRIVVHLSGWAKAAPGDTLELDPQKQNQRSIALR